MMVCTVCTYYIVYSTPEDMVMHLKNWKIDNFPYDLDLPNGSFVNCLTSPSPSPSAISVYLEGAGEANCHTGIITFETKLHRAL